MKKYNSYKDSGIKWIGMIPNHWDIKKLKYSCHMFGRIGFRGYSQADLVGEGEGAITLSPSNMDSMSVDYKKCSYLSWEKYYESPEIMVKRGDVLLVKTASVGKCSYVYNMPQECTVNPQILVLKEHKDNPLFLTYLFQTPIGQTYIDLYKVGSTIPTLSEDKIGGFTFAFPPISEQNTIVNYLDKKCEEIDKAITFLQKKINLLRELRQKIITDAVTRGINSDVKLKDSGIKWIGKVPEHWVVCRIKNILMQGSNSIKIGPFGSSLTGKVGENLEYKVYGQWNIVGADFTAGLNTVNKETFAELSKSYKVVSGDVLVSMMGTIGKCAVIPEGIQEGIMDSHVVKIRLDKSKMNSTFFEYIYDKDKSNVVFNQLQQMKGGSIMDGLNSSIIKNLTILVPPIAEQQEIINFVNNQVSSFDKSISKAEKQISLLQELKQSIITEVVTGKRKVV